MSTLTAPPPAPRSLTAPPELRGLMSGGAPMPAADVTDSYTALVGAGEAAWFVVASDGDAVRMQLVSPSGVRIEAAAPQDAGMFWYTAHQITEVEAGTWTIEVSGSETEIPSSSYAVTAHTQQPPGLGIALTGQVDDLCAVGIPSEIAATVTVDGAPLTGSTVTATVVQPDGTPLTPIDLAEISDAGVDTDGDGRFDQLVVEIGVEVDVAAGYRLHGTLFDGAGATIEQVTVDVELSTGAQTVPLAFDGGGLFAAGADDARADLDAGVGIVEFRFSAPSIFAVGRAGPYTLRTLSLQGTAADGTLLFLREPDVVTVTQPYRLEDFAESPRFTVGGTVTGLIGFGQLELQLSCVGPPFTPETVKLRPGNGPFVFPIARLVSGNTYAVVVTQQPTTPAQTCTITNNSGTVEDGNVTDITVTCT